ncbi:MAG: NAD-binding protein, partial [Xanthomonadales bacterium]|nr:NAD-binding protein [Xanthomonadales bacterium]
LEQAGIRDASGIIAGTGDDIDNLSIVMTARELKPDIFVVARQEKHTNDQLFDASEADLVARRSLIVARRVLAIATTPLLQAFLEYMVRQDDEFAERCVAQCEKVLHGTAPSLWTIDTRGEFAAGLRTAREHGAEVKLSHVTYNSRIEYSEHLDCVCLVLERGASRIFLPGEDEVLLEGDHLLFAGRDVARREMLWSLSSPDALLAFATGHHLPSGALGRWIRSRNLPNLESDT